MKRLLLIFAVSILVPVIAHAGGGNATTEEALAMVEKAVAYIELNGLEQACAEVCNKQGNFIYKDLFVVILDLDGTYLAHGAKPEWIGKNLISIPSPFDGTYVIREIVTACSTKRDGWITFLWPNTATGGGLEMKKCYFRKVGNAIVFSGAFE